MFERATTFWRPTSAEDEPPRPPAQRQDARDGLTRAQARAQSRCAPLTPDEFRERRRMVERGLDPLSTVFAEGAHPRSR